MTATDHRRHGHGHASVPQTIANMAKTCMGTGCLALPFAAKQSGILPHVFGLVAVALWNTITVQLLCSCYDLTMSDISSTLGLAPESDEPFSESSGKLLKRPQHTGKSYGSTSTNHLYNEKDTEAHLSMDTESHSLSERAPPSGTTTLGKLAWYAWGRSGTYSLDLVMVLYLVGVIVTYLNAMRSFLRDTPFSTGVRILDSLFLVIVMATISLVPHTGYLSRASVLGLAVLLATFLVIAWYGFTDAQNDDNLPIDSRWDEMAEDSKLSETVIHRIVVNTTVVSANGRGIWLPINGFASVSKWFGCVVFGFGVTPLTFSFREAMEVPRNLLWATQWAMVVVGVSYATIGVGLLLLYPNIEGDVLHELPTRGWLPILTRLAMVVVVLMTAPLLIVPCGEIIEKRLLALHDHAPLSAKNAWYLHVTIRWSICLVCAVISAMVPGFVDVLSFVGCCCVAVVGFCLPPLLHLILSWQRGVPISSLGFDLALLLWGLFATAVSTIYTYREIS